MFSPKGQRLNPWRGGPGLVHSEGKPFRRETGLKCFCGLRGGESRAASGWEGRWKSPGPPLRRSPRNSEENREQGGNSQHQRTSGKTLELEPEGSKMPDVTSPAGPDDAEAEAEPWRPAFTHTVFGVLGSELGRGRGIWPWGGEVESPNIRRWAGSGFLEEPGVMTAKESHGPFTFLCTEHTDGPCRG